MQRTPFSYEYTLFNVTQRRSAGFKKKRAWSDLAVSQVHQPAQAEKGPQEAGEAVHRIPETFAVGPLGYDPQHHRRDYGKKQGSLEM
jgi:hypothetical protein